MIIRSGRKEHTKKTAEQSQHSVERDENKQTHIHKVKGQMSSQLLVITSKSEINLLDSLFSFYLLFLVFFRFDF